MYNLVDRLKAGRESKERFRDHYNDQLLDLLCGGRAISDRELEIEIAGWANVFGLTLRRDEVENWACYRTERERFLQNETMMVVFDDALRGMTETFSLDDLACAVADTGESDFMVFAARWFIEELSSTTSDYEMRSLEPRVSAEVH